MSTPQTVAQLGTIPLAPLGVGNAPQDYIVPGAQVLDLLAVRAVYDGTAASGQFVPVVQILDTNGNVMAQRKGTPISPGGSADVTFAPFLSRAGSTPGVALGYDPWIATLGPDAWWKLDESAGVTAADSSGNGHDIDATSTPVSWAFSIAPPGRQAPQLAILQSFGNPAVGLSYSPNLSGDFTLVSWYLSNGPPSGGNDNVFSQGNPSGSHSGFLLGIEAGNVGLGNRLSLIIGTGASSVAIESSTVITYGAWHLLGFVHKAGVFTLWVDGVAQPSTWSGAYASTTVKLIVGPPVGHVGQQAYALLMARALDDTAMQTLYSGVTG